MHCTKSQSQTLYSARSLNQLELFKILSAALFTLSPILWKSHSEAFVLQIPLFSIVGTFRFVRVRLQSRIWNFMEISNPTKTDPQHPIQSWQLGELDISLCNIITLVSNSILPDFHPADMERFKILILRPNHPCSWLLRVLLLRMKRMH